VLEKDFVVIVVVCDVVVVGGVSGVVGVVGTVIVVVVIMWVVVVVGGAADAVVGLNVVLIVVCGKTENNSISLSFRTSFDVKSNITDTIFVNLGHIYMNAPLHAHNYTNTSRQTVTHDKRRVCTNIHA